MESVQIDARALLAFFDEKAQKQENQDANAVNALAGEDLGLGLGLDYLRRTGAHANVVPQPCTTGRRNGPRLDGWIAVEKAGERLLYQIEVKNWTAHSYQGKSLSVDAKPSVVDGFARQRWQDFWLPEKQLYWGADKVLVRMAKPLGYADWPVVPLVIFWFAIARDGAAHPLTIQSRDVPTESEFPSIHLFSLSLHLRQMLPAAPFLHIEAPRIARRMRRLSRIFPSVVPASVQ